MQLADPKTPEDIQFEMHELRAKTEDSLAASAQEASRLAEANQERQLIISELEDELKRLRPPPPSKPSNPTDSDKTSSQMKAPAPKNKSRRASFISGITFGSDNKLKQKQDKGDKEQQQRRSSLDMLREKEREKNRQEVIKNLKEEQEMDIIDIRNAIIVRREEAETLNSNHERLKTHIDSIRVQILNERSKKKPVIQSASRKRHSRRQSISAAIACVDNVIPAKDRKEKLLTKRKETKAEIKVLHARMEYLEESTNNMEPDIREELVLAKDRLENVQDDIVRNKTQLEDAVTELDAEHKSLRIQVAMRQRISCKCAHRLKKKAKIGHAVEKLLDVIEKGKTAIGEEMLMREADTLTINEVMETLKHVENLSEIAVDCVYVLLENLEAQDSLLPGEVLPGMEKMGGTLEECKVGALFVKATIFRTLEVYVKDKDLVDTDTGGSAASRKRKEDEIARRLSLCSYASTATIGTIDERGSTIDYMGTEQAEKLKERKGKLEEIVAYVRTLEKEIMGKDEKIDELREMINQAKANAKRIKSQKLKQMDKLQKTVKAVVQRGAEKDLELKARMKLIDGLKDKERILQEQINAFRHED
mmetsp:Transcript_26254/g.40264  ORF Transcript_26254/g.40264 Transcript_26254/m.40264 type:complete len:592 (-) Transcript_26254:486-2261(-)